MARILRVWKKYGASLPWVMFRKLLATFMTLETLVVYSRPVGTASTVSARASSMPVIRIDDASSEVFGQLCNQYPDKKFRERIRNEGQHCFVAMSADNIAGYAWVSRDDLYVDEIARTYPVAPNEMFIYDCFVDAEYRGAGVYAAMLEAALRDNNRRNRNLRQALIAASSLNRASIRGILKAGFTEQRRIRYVACLHKQIWWGLDPVEA